MRWFLDRPLRYKTTVIAVVFALLPLLAFSAFFFRAAREEAYRRQLRAVRQILALTAGSVHSLLQDLDAKTCEVYSREDLLRPLCAARKAPLSTPQAYYLRQGLSNFVSSDGRLVSAYLFYGEGQATYWGRGGGAAEMRALYEGRKRRIEALGGGLYVLPTYVPASSGGRGAVLPVARLLRDTTAALEPMGVLVACFDLDAVDRVCRPIGLSPGGALLLLDGEGRILWSAAPGQITQPFSAFYREEGGLSADGEGVRYFRFEEPIGYNGWRCVGLVPQADIYGAVHSLWVYMWAGLGILAAFFLLLLHMLSRYIVSPIHRIAAHMGLGKDLPAPSSLPGDEIGFLCRSFNRMNARNRELLAKVREGHRIQLFQEAKALKAQINPHFLYNTLDTINWAAMENGQDEICRMIGALSGVLRYSVKFKSETVPLQDELTWLQNYIYIQKQRFEDKFDIAYDIDQTLLGCKVFHLILQPFVENAILHGFGNLSSGGLIRVGAHALGGDLQLVIADNGVGLQPQMAEKIALGVGGGIGIHNIHQLLRLTFGPNYGVRLLQNPGGGTRVELLLKQVR